MVEIKEVITSLQTCSDVFYGEDGLCSKMCSFSQTDKCFMNLIHSTIELLKEYQKKETPVESELEGSGRNWWVVCPECHGNIGTLDNYCKHCGKHIRNQ